MYNKGQTALEYLITYGWAILVILVVLAVLWYYDIFNPAAWGGPQVISGTSFQVLDYNLVGGASPTISIVLGNKGAFPLNITSISISGDATGSSPNATGYYLAGGGNITVSNLALTGTISSASTYSLVAAVTYDNLQTGLTGKGDTLTFNNIQAA